MKIQYPPRVQRKAEQEPAADRDAANATEAGKDADGGSPKVVEAAGADMGEAAKDTSSKDAGAESAEAKTDEGKEAEGEDAANGAPAEESTSQKVSAKLKSLSRKIHRAEDKSGAALSRLGNAGQDKAALRQAVQNAGHEREQAKAALTSVLAQIPEGRTGQVEQNARRAVQSAQNALDSHLTDSDITGAMRDAAADPVRAPGSGRPWDHAGEVNDAVRSLQNARTALVNLRRERLQRGLDQPTVDGQLQPALDALQAAIQRAGQAVKAVKP